MRRFDTILFDLDGTLTDNGEGITNSIAYALRKFGITPPPREELNKLIGPPLRESFVQHFVSEDRGDLAVEYYREYFRPHGIFENHVYDGVRQLLDRLKAEGVTLAIATSKPEIFAKQVAEHFDLARYFTVIAGSLMDGGRTDKAEVIGYCLDLLGRPERALMVGDRRHDIIGARRAGLPAVGVAYGYGSREELEEAEALAVIGQPLELLEYL